LALGASRTTAEANFGSGRSVSLKCRGGFVTGGLVASGWGFVAGGFLTAVAGGLGGVTVAGVGRAGVVLGSGKREESKRELQSSLGRGPRRRVKYVVPPRQASLRGEAMFWF